MLPSSESLSTDKITVEEERPPPSSYSAQRQPAEMSSPPVCFNYINVINFTKMIKIIWFINSEHPSPTLNNIVNQSVVMKLVIAYLFM